MFRDKETMSKVGLVRIILLRHSGEEKWNGLQLTQIVGTEVWQFGHICQKSNNDWISKDWIAEDIDVSCRDQIDELFKDKPIGFYEMTASFYHESWQCYEGDYDSHSELRDISIVETTYKQARRFDEYEFLQGSEVPVVGDKKASDYYPDRGILISPYMPRTTILKTQAAVLCRLIESYGERVSFEGMTDEQLENLAFVYSLEIQTKAAKEGVYGVVYLDKMEQIIRVTKEVLQEHDLWMKHAS